MLSRLYKYLILLFLLVVGGNSAHGQSSRNLYGREFWVTFTENLFADTFHHLLVTPTVIDTIKVYNPQLNQSAVFIVKPGIQNIIRVAKTSLNFWYCTASFIPQNKGVFVTSKQGDFALQAVNTVSGSTDIAAILPMQVLSNAREYLVHTAAGGSGKECQAAVIAIDTGITTVEFTAGCDLTGLGGKGNVFTRDLKYGQVFLIQALDTQNLSGTIIKTKNSCKRIAVFAGAKCARVLDVGGCSGCDVLYEQMYPTWALGSNYFAPPVPENKTWIISTVALYNNTNVIINGFAYPPMNKGEVLQKSFTGPAIVRSDLPVSCMQLLKSSGCNGATTPSGDPSSMMLAPSGSGVLAASTSVYRNASYSVNKAVVVAKTQNSPVIKLNGIAIPSSSFQKFTSGVDFFWYAETDLKFNKTWQLQSDSLFQAYQIGIANFESYATCIGVSFPNYKADFSFSPSPVCDPNAEIQFTSNGDSLGAFTWFFGDGTTATGKSAKHIYGKTGIFKAGISNPSTLGCADSIALIVKVLQGPKMLLPKDTQPCLGTIFRLELPSNKGYNYTWDNGSNSIFQSFPVSKVAILTTTDTQGCQTIDTMKVDYKNCDVYDLKLANVFTPNGDGFNDEWKVIYKAYKSIDVSIFNRWGEMMYGYTLPDNEHWNGMVDNKFVQCPEGVYFYRIIANETTGKKQEFSGTIHLMR